MIFFKVAYCFKKDVDLYSLSLLYHVAVSHVAGDLKWRLAALTVTKMLLSMPIVFWVLSNSIHNSYKYPHLCVTLFGGECLRPIKPLVGCSILDNCRPLMALGVLYSASKKIASGTSMQHVCLDCVISVWK